jgi:hypothetical protein
VAVNDLAAFEPGGIEVSESCFKWRLGQSPVPCPMRTMGVVVPLIFSRHLPQMAKPL